MYPEELQEVVDWILSGEVDFRQDGWEDTYPTNEDILEYARGVPGIVMKRGKDEKSKC